MSLFEFYSVIYNLLTFLYKNFLDILNLRTCIRGAGFFSLGITKENPYNQKQLGNKFPWLSDKLMIKTKHPYRRLSCFKAFNFYCKCIFLYKNDGWSIYRNIFWCVWCQQFNSKKITTFISLRTTFLKTLIIKLFTH